MEVPSMDAEAAAGSGGVRVGELAPELETPDDVRGGIRVRPRHLALVPAEAVAAPCVRRNPVAAVPSCLEGRSGLWVEFAVGLLAWLRTPVGAGRSSRVTP